MLSPLMLRLLLGGAVLAVLGCQAAEPRLASKADPQAALSWAYQEVQYQQPVALYGFDGRRGALRFVETTTAPLFIYTGPSTGTSNAGWQLASQIAPTAIPPASSDWRFVLATSDAISRGSRFPTTFVVASQPRFQCPLYTLDADTRPSLSHVENTAQAALPLSSYWQVGFDSDGHLRLGSAACQKTQLARNYLAQRTAGFYTTGMVGAVLSLMSAPGSGWIIPRDSANLVARAAAYQLQARGLLRPDGEALVPVNLDQWSNVASRAVDDLRSYTFHGVTGDPEAELGRLAVSDAFSKVIEETPARDAFLQLQHHGHVWVPLMTLLNHAQSASGVDYISALTSADGLPVMETSDGARMGIQLLIADGLVVQTDNRYHATRLGQDALPKLTRWSGLLASYYSLGDSARLQQELQLPATMIAVDDRHLNVASSGAGLARFAESFVLPQLEELVASAALQTVVGVGSGSGGLERMIVTRFPTLDVFGSDLDESDAEGRHALDVAREALDGVIAPARIFAADIRDPDTLITTLRTLYVQEGRSPGEIEQKIAHTAITSGFITHEPRSFTAEEVTAMFNGYAQHVPHFILLEIPLVDPQVHAAQPDAHFGVEIGTFHIASGQTVRPLEEWHRIIEASDYRIVAQATFNKIWNPNTAQYDIPSYVGFHLARK